MPQVPLLFHPSPSLSCITSSPEAWWLQKVDIYYVMISVSQESESGSAGGSGLGSLPGWQSGCRPALQSSEDVTGAERSTSEMAPSQGCWQEVSAPPAWSVFVGLLGLASPRANDPRENKAKSTPPFITECQSLLTLTPAILH